MGTTSLKYVVSGLTPAFGLGLGTRGMANVLGLLIPLHFWRAPQGYLLLCFEVQGRADISYVRERAVVRGGTAVNHTRRDCTVHGAQGTCCPSCYPAPCSQCVTHVQPSWPSLGDTETAFVQEAQCGLLPWPGQCCAQLPGLTHNSRLSLSPFFPPLPLSCPHLTLLISCLD